MPVLVEPRRRSRSPSCSACMRCRLSRAGAVGGAGRAPRRATARRRAARRARRGARRPALDARLLAARRASATSTRTGRPWSCPNRAARAWRPWSSATASPWRRSSTTPSLADERELIHAVGAAAALALENERLDAELRAQRRGAARLARRASSRPADEERRAARARPPRRRPAAARLAGARRCAWRDAPRERRRRPPSSCSTTRRRELDAATAELRELARGIHPAVLTDRGLGRGARGARRPRAGAGRAGRAAAASGCPRRSSRPPTSWSPRRSPTSPSTRARHARDGQRRARRTARSRSRSRDDGVGGADPARGLGPARARRPASPRSTAGSRSTAARGGGHDRASGDPVRVVVADDSVLLREGIVRLLEEAGFEVVGQAGDAEDLLRKVRRAQARRRGRRHPHATRPTPTRACAPRARSAPSCRTPACWCSPSTSRRATRWSCSRDSAEGVGYLLKDRVADVDRFVDAVRRVADGGSALDPEVVSQMLGRRRRDDPLAELTPREREVLGLMAEGRSNQAIADAAGRHRARGREARDQHLRQARPAAGAGGPPPGARGARLPARLTGLPGTNSASTAPIASTTTASGSAATTPSENACGLS